MLRQCLISTFSEIRNIYVESYSAETFTEDQKMIDALLETREISPSLLRVMYGMTPAQLGRLDETMEQAVFGLLTPDQLCRLDEVMGQRQLRGLSSAQRHQLDEIIKYKVFHGLSSEKLRRIDEVMAQLGFAGLSQKQIWQLDEVVGPKYRDSPTTKERRRPPDVIMSLRLAIAYWREAGKECERTKYGAAWSSLVQANYFLGMASGPKSAADVGSKGSEGKDKLFAPLMDYAAALIRDEQNWPSGGFANRTSAMGSGSDVVSILSRVNAEYERLSREWQGKDPSGERKGKGLSGRPLENVDCTQLLESWDRKGGVIKEAFDLAIRSRRPR